VAVLDACGICNVWGRVAVAHAQPPLRERVGVKVMLCRLLVKRSGAE